MEQEHKKEIERIIGSIQCPKDFICYKSGLEILCKAKDIGDGSYTRPYLVCSEENPSQCKFSVHFGDSYYCKCPLRAYIAKEVKKK